MVNSELYKALNELYCCVIKVMSLVNPSMVDEKMRHEAITRALDNFLRDFQQMSTTSEPIQTPPPISDIITPKPPQIHSVSSQNTMTESISAQNIEPAHSTEIKYCYSSTIGEDNDWILRRASKNQKEDWFYKLTITGDVGKFEIMDLDGDSLSFYLAGKDNMLPEGAVVVQGDITNAKKLTTIVPGTIVKKGTYWKITEKVTVKLS